MERLNPRLKQAELLTTKKKKEVKKTNNFKVISMKNNL